MGRGGKEGEREGGRKGRRKGRGRENMYRLYSRNEAPLCISHL